MIIQFRYIICLLLFASCAINADNQQKVILFDVDGVLVHENNFSNFWHLYTHTHHKRTVLKATSTLRKKPYKEKREKFDLNALIDQLTEEQPILNKKEKSGKTVGEHMKEAFSRAKPKQRTQRLMFQLHGQQHLIGIATNRGSFTFNHLKQQGTIPYLNYVIEFTVDCTENNPTPQGYHKKPSIQYFINLDAALTKAGITGPRYFIDDKKENVDAAIKAGFIGIHYKDSKQLHKALIQYNLLPQH